LYIQGTDASGYLNEVGHDGTIDKAEVTNLLSVGKQYIPGEPDSTVSTDGFFDGNVSTDSLSFSYFIESLKGLQTNVLYLPQGDALGNFGYSAQGFLTKVSIKTNTTDAGKNSLEFQNSTGLERGIVLHKNQTEAAAGNTVGQDNTTSSLLGGAGYLHVFSVSGTSTPTLTAKIQHSPDNSAWTDLIAFTNATLAQTSQRATVAGTINRYTRALWTYSGTSPVFGFSVFLKRN